MPVINATGILTQKFLPVAGWQIFGNGGIAKYHYGQGDIWLVQARLLQKAHIPNAAIALKMLLSLGGTAKPAVVIDPGTEAPNNVTSLFIDFMNANDIPFETIGEIAAGG